MTPAGGPHYVTSYGWTYPLMCNETARIEPVSAPAVSSTKNFHVPSTDAPRRPPSGSIERYVPVNGAPADAIDAMEFAAVSSNTTWQKLLPLPPLLLNTVAVAPFGAVSVPTRSPTKVWSRPTVVEPMSVPHVVPSIENVIRAARPMPDTGMFTLAPTELLSG